jgi:hypothetical protein
MGKFDATTFCSKKVDFDRVRNDGGAASTGHFSALPVLLISDAVDSDSEATYG